MRNVLKAVRASVAAVLLVVLSVAAWFAYGAFGDRSKPVRETSVVIARGTSFNEVAQQLADDGVIANRFAFRLLARTRRADVAIHAGAYRIPAHQTESEVLQSLLSGGAQVAVWVTIPEGFTAAQVAERLHDAGIGKGENLAERFDADTLEIGGARTRNLEGYLFPSTYLVATDALPEQVTKQMTDEFFKELPADAAARARALRVTIPQAVTVASLVEREAKIDGDRSLIAGVIYNRLRLHVPLQVDATIEYALPAHKTELSFADLKIDSPYNTYVHEGLPPTPIANPGGRSLFAAFHPARTEDLYYVYCGNGKHVFARTLAEHQTNVARCLH